MSKTSICLLKSTPISTPLNGSFSKGRTMVNKQFRLTMTTREIAELVSLRSWYSKKDRNEASYVQI